MQMTKSTLSTRPAIKPPSPPCFAPPPPPPLPPPPPPPPLSSVIPLVPLSSSTLHSAAMHALHTPSSYIQSKQHASQSCTWLVLAPGALLKSHLPSTGRGWQAVRSSVGTGVVGFDDEGEGVVVGFGDAQSDVHNVSHAPPASQAMEGLLLITHVIKLLKLHTESGTLPDNWFELRYMDVSSDSCASSVGTDEESLRSYM
mmetsp:Transcript_40966/g.94446  ORF Transcript_40966/g.94446 Transcript_40966/m.94446 type:complete len:200 (-) Transcript_40966:660-1259(-)